MPGAGVLAAKAALKSGAGKTYLCGTAETGWSDEIIAVPQDLQIFEQLLDNINCVVAGPGLGNDADEFLDLIWNSRVPLILDADGLRWLADRKPEKRSSFFIGTPHPGEAKTLLNRNISDRFEALEDLQTLYGGQWILKGAGTLVGPKPTYVNPFSNSILSTAGSGDVLAGIIGGLIASQEKKPALLGVWLHSEAARLLLKKGEKRILASELISVLGKAFNKLEEC